MQIIQHIIISMENTAEMEKGGGGGGGPVSSRWNPTKEQISILESMYKQGVRTPSADQIQQITSRLKAYGHIEGKNVFYWFQNHKARQRQKQKQEHSFAYFNHFLHFPNHHPSFPSPPNVVCSPYYVHQNDVGFYPQYHNNSKMVQTQSTGIMRRRSKSDTRNCNNNININMTGGFGCESIQNEEVQTLSLFPTHPTGDLQVGPPPPQMTASEASASSGNSADDLFGGGRAYFDFFL